jgi:Flp pilus assembly protein TadG
MNGRNRVGRPAYASHPLRHRRAVGGERGQAMVELAMVLPVLAVLLFGVIQFGIVFNNYLTLTDATRAGARAGAVARNDSNPAAETTSAVQTSASDLNQSNLSVSVNSSWTQGSDVTVTATYPYSINLLGWVIASGNLQSTTTERVE